VSYIFRPLGAWPYPDTNRRRPAHTFTASWSDTIWILESELEHLGAEHVVIQADFDESQIRVDGMIRADARQPYHPGVIISFESSVGPLRYATDAHAKWQHNVRGIALGLAALRAVDRYGITRDSEQYRGWKQITAGSSVTSTQMAKDLIERLSGSAIEGHLTAATAYRRALKIAHPDHGGSSDLLAAVMDAGRLLGVK
jgi:hypothetical protein